MVVKNLLKSFYPNSTFVDRLESKKKTKFSYVILCENKCLTDFALSMLSQSPSERLISSEFPSI